MHRTTVTDCSRRAGHGECAGVWLECSCGFAGEYPNEPTARARALEHAAGAGAGSSDEHGFEVDDDPDGEHGFLVLEDIAGELDYSAWPILEATCDNCGEYDAVAFPVYGRTYDETAGRWISAMIGAVRYCEACARVAGLRY